MNDPDAIGIDEFVELTGKCYKKLGSSCPGDSGDAKCFFCPSCVLGIEERVMNLTQYIKQMEEQKC